MYSSRGLAHSDEMSRNRAQGHGPHLRVAGHFAAGMDLCAEMFANRRVLRDAQGGAVDGPPAQSLEGATRGVLLAPGPRGSSE
ncbi:hypothetical protein BGL_1c22910 [Burkholderia plantarii]|uniref:Uncharacterized protein n=1 Tax=Burkholderia plantarii TaxID=41899 RepID=A0A0B6S0E7_BURPL|nr:hypothetical protein BGL_1c22910 [Burkholderia plantarii]